MNPKIIEWEDRYSVGVKLIDDQHKVLVDIVNSLIGLLASTPTKEKVDEIIARILDYKEFHFTTEEGYFKEFNYEKKDEHIAIHNKFNSTLEKIVADSKGDSIVLAFNLVDFLEDWLIHHFMIEDQKYVKCFHEHGLS